LSDGNGRAATGRPRSWRPGERTTGTRQLGAGQMNPQPRRQTLRKSKRPLTLFASFRRRDRCRPKPSNHETIPSRRDTSRRVRNAHNGRDSPYSRTQRAARCEHDPGPSPSRGAARLEEKSRRPSGGRSAGATEDLGPVRPAPPPAGGGGGEHQNPPPHVLDGRARCLTTQVCPDRASVTRDVNAASASVPSKETHAWGKLDGRRSSRGTPPGARDALAHVFAAEARRASGSVRNPMSSAVADAGLRRASATADPARIARLAANKGTAWKTFCAFGARPGGKGPDPGGRSIGRASRRARGPWNAGKAARGDRRLRRARTTSRTARQASRQPASRALAKFRDRATKM